MREYRIIGPPGTGKTFALTRQIEAECERHWPGDILVMSHTNAAAREIAGRDSLLPKENVGTLHSFAFRSLETKCEPADSPKGLRAFSEANPDWAVTQMADATEDVWGSRDHEDGARCLAEYGRLRNRMTPRSEWPEDVLAFAETWEWWKREEERIDFTDMIELALTETDHAPRRPSVLFVDELQDLSALQFALVRHWGAKAERVITAGDSDQTIYQFAGSDPATFSTNQPREQRVLARSHRVPRAVHAAAMAWVEQIEDRDPISYQPRDADGQLDHSDATWRFPEPIVEDVLAELASGRTVMVAASCGYMLAPFLSICRREAIPFGNRWCLTRGDWNPLGRGADRHAAVRGVSAFLSPSGDVGGDPSWTVEDAQTWAECVKGVFRRNGRARLNDLDAGESEFGVACTLAEIVRPENWAFVATRDLDWLEQQLDSQHAKLGSYAAGLARVHGPQVLTEEPRLSIGSIHSFKGGEADTVFVFPDLSQAGYEEWIGEGRDSVIRQFYVGMTRARERLVLCSPCSGRTVRWVA